MYEELVWFCVHRLRIYPTYPTYRCELITVGAFMREHGTDCLIGHVEGVRR
jgi:hypothetical protein